MLSGKRKVLVEFGLRTTCRGGGMADAADLKSVVRKDVRVRLPPSAPYLFLTRFHVFHQLSPGNDLSPKSEDVAKMATLFLTGLPFELDHGAPWLCESVDCIF